MYIHCTFKRRRYQDSMCIQDLTKASVFKEKNPLNKYKETVFNMY
jgi:hypothetical protein